MAAKLQRRMVAKLFRACVLMAVFYLVLRLRETTTWATNRAILSPLWKQTSTLKDSIRSATGSGVSKTPTTTDAIPRKLWYKIGPAGLKKELKPCVKSCLENPDYEFEFLTDESGDDFVKEHYSWNPNLVKTFLSINIPIIKADLLRYLILYEMGGIWIDLDVSCEAPINEWIPDQYRSAAATVVGMEFDSDRWQRQLATWTIMAKPKQPHFLIAVEGCLENLAAAAKRLHVPISDLKRNMIDDIIDVSGPRRMTKSIYQSLSKSLNREVGNNDIANVTEPRLLGDVLILPDHSFADSMNMWWGDKVPGRKLVVHHYARSWRNEKGGE
ncbi:hypothetical protein PpBr36_05523 [Pyricularia pennisetigena]|uniref:hypothetical protein n=1 Tax=Pyricularia pennisetigena TaxID=1578925 RepID=UPI001153A226|nr:hypothetical protein PpBr36_05523 [Pyricularia pennisetigena]TLS27287.1 hypothetical protein PpBr36_05523 [Pyricularia pennisetigena]